MNQRDEEDHSLLNNQRSSVLNSSSWSALSRVIRRRESFGLGFLLLFIGITFVLQPLPDTIPEKPVEIATTRTGNEKNLVQVTEQQPVDVENGEPVKKNETRAQPSSSPVTESFPIPHKDYGTNATVRPTTIPAQDVPENESGDDQKNHTVSVNATETDMSGEEPEENDDISESEEGDTEPYDEESEYGKPGKRKKSALEESGVEDEDWKEQRFQNWTEELQWKAQNCRKQMEGIDSMSLSRRRLLEADCGLGYNLTASPARNSRWNVVFYSTVHNGMTLYTGCPTFGRGGCPLSPQCRMIITDNPSHLKNADVVVVYQKEPRRIVTVPYNSTTRKPFRVMLWREALWAGPHEPVQRTYYDLEMGTHHTAGVPNPHWWLAPSDLLSGRLFTSDKLPFIPVEKRTRFAISIISHCDAPSFRDNYLSQLSTILGEDKVHRFGSCGTRKLPPRPISNAAKLIARYKFYFSFENTIQEGYVTEKLLETIALPILPVYYGAPGVPNLTVTPSFIRASEFRTPKALAEFLLYLDANPAEYNKYHSWRDKVNPFDDYYLDLMKYRIAGPLEVEAHSIVPMKDNKHDELNYQFYHRRSQCCRLCDVNHLAMLRDTRTQVVPDPWTEDQIDSFFFSGKMYGEGVKPQRDSIPGEKLRQLG